MQPGSQCNESLNNGTLADSRPATQAGRQAGRQVGRPIYVHSNSTSHRSTAPRTFVARHGRGNVSLHNLVRNDAAGT